MVDWLYYDSHRFLDAQTVSAAAHLRQRRTSGPLAIARPCPAPDRYLAQKYGMHFERFGQYLHERSELLAAGRLSPDEQQALGQAVVLEEDDWMEWKATREMLESWLGLDKEVNA
jgi:hypothetical protein